MSEQHRIESPQNRTFRDFRDLLQGDGVRKHGRALVAGERLVTETLARRPERCRAWITGEPGDAPPGEIPWFRLAGPLFRELDLFGTRRPLLVIDAPELPAWTPEDGFPEGVTLLLPFQDPENVGAAIRSAVAFGASLVVLLRESAHPYHPKSLRASAGALLAAPLRRGPGLGDLRPSKDLIALSSIGRDIARERFPERFGLVAGQEGPGLPGIWRDHAVAVPISEEVESLNAAAAIAVALYAWSRSRVTG